jgi:CRP-like cAMP-binding protein/Ca2+-binding EF-hand superfamily protein
MEGSPGGARGFRERDFGDEEFGDYHEDDSSSSGAPVSDGGRAADRPGPRAWASSQLELEQPAVPASPSRKYSPRGALAHGLDGWDSPPLEPEPAPMAPALFDLDQLHDSMESTAVQQELSPDQRLELMEDEDSHSSERALERAELEGGCPALCVKYGSWPLGFLLASVSVVIYVTSVAAHASVMTDAERDKAADLAERKRAYYERHAAEDKARAPAVEDEGLDVAAVLFLVVSLLFGLYGLYAFCTRPEDNTRHGLPTQEQVEEDARVCRETAADGSPREVDDGDDDDTAALVSAFEACDVDGSGQIDAAEFHAILAAIGTTITVEEVATIVEECESFYANFARISKVIRKVPLFAPLPDWQLRQLAESLQTVRCVPGDVVIREGDSGQEMYLVEVGELACTKSGIHQGQVLRKYSDGDFFGERALLVNESRAATITALSNCTLHKLTSRSCQDFLHANKLVSENLEDIERTYKISMLRKIPLLQPMPESELRTVCRDLNFLQFSAGDTVIQEGDTSSRDLFIVEIGTLAARKRAYDWDQVLKYYSEGDYFGERALISNEPRAASVYAETDVRVLRLSSSSYQLVLRNRGARNQLQQQTAAYGQAKRADITGHLSGANKAWQRGFNKVTAFKPIKPAAKMVSNVENIARAAVSETEHIAQRGVSMVGHAAQDVVTGALDVTTHVVSNVVSDVAGLAGFGQSESIDEDTQDGELDFQEFCQLMRGPLLAPYLAGADGDWRKRVGQIQQLRRAYDIADVDGDNELEKDELALVLVSLNPTASIQTEDIDHVWNCMNPEGKEFLTWAEFLGGLKGVRQDERASRCMDLGASNKWELISLLIDTKSSQLEHEMLMEGLSPFEILGVHVLETLKTEMDTVGLKDVLSRVSAGNLHILTDERKKAIHGHRRNVAIYAFTIAFVTNFM